MPTMYRIWQQLASGQCVGLDLASRDVKFLEKVLDLYVEYGHGVRGALEIRKEQVMSCMCGDIRCWSCRLVAEAEARMEGDR